VTNTAENRFWSYCKSRTVVDADPPGESFCHAYNGSWYVGVQDKCRTQPTTVTFYYEAEVTGTLHTAPNETTTTVIEAVIQVLVATKLGIEPNKVIVVVTVTPNSDGSSNFKVDVKVKTSDITSDRFNTGVDSIFSSTVQNSMTSQGVDVKYVSGIVASKNYAGKLFVSVVVALLVMLM
jgi:hypothetical protein